MASDLSNAEIGVEGEYAYCDTCGLLFHWEQLTLSASGAYYCDDHTREEDDASDALHDSQRDVEAGEGITSTEGNPNNRLS